MTISVFNDARIPARSLDEAEQVASRIFRKAGIQVEWVNCPVPAEELRDPTLCQQAVFPEHLHLRILVRPLRLTESTFGVSYLSADGSGCYSGVFVEPAEELHEAFHVSLAAVMGHVAAHEIAHLLLGANSHAASGIMRAHWYRGELASASKGGLLFTQAEGRIMRKLLSGGLGRGELTVPVPTGR